MRKNFLGFLLGVAVTSLIAFKVANYEVKPSTSEVNRIEGLLIFTDCKPVMDYEYLGTVKSNTGGFGNPLFQVFRRVTWKFK